MKLLYQYLRKYRWVLVLTLFLAAINMVFSLFDPMIFRNIIDHYLVKSEQGSMASNIFFGGVLTLIGLSMGSAMVSRIAKNFQDYFTNVIIQKLSVEMYTDGLRHSLGLPYSVFEDQRSGETLGILQKVKADIEKLLNSFIGVVFTTLVGVVFVFVFAIRIYWLIAPVYFAMIPILGIISSFLSKKIKTVQKKIVGETTALAGSTTESLRNIELVKSLGLTDQEIIRLNSTSVKILGLELKKLRYIRVLSFTQGTIVNALRSVLLFTFTVLIFHKRMTVGDMIALQFYSFFIFGPLQELGNVVSAYREAEVSLGNFQKILDTPKDPKPQNPVEVKDMDTIAFDGVSFKHATAKTSALNDISFEVQRGQTIAFAGPSGSGKTTMVKLLVGLYPPATGHVLYNGVPENKIDLDKLRENIGLVTQDAQLFSGSIKENLLFVAPNATDAEIMDVLHKAACENLLARADKGIDTVIGEGGVKVSGGEKQRLSIARALLRKPSLLVFDEATSALDSLTEEEISKTIRDVSQNAEHITILIAHRLSTILHADKIFVLEKGNIIESGKHQELLEMKGLYYAMWRQQIGEHRASRETQLA